MYSKKIKRFKRIYIEITNICNMDCSFCPNTTRKKEYMTVENFEQIVKKTNEYTDYIYLHVKGEPLMHKDLIQILDICGKYNMQVNITTNGTLINYNKELLKDSKAIRQLNISLHSFENINDKKVEENLYECVSAAKYIKDNSNIIIAFRLWNIQSDFEEVSDLNKKCIDTIQDVFEVFDISDKLMINNNIKVEDKVFLNMEYQFEWPNIEKEELNTVGKCYGLKDQIAILVDGTVVPCCLDNNGDINLGNIFDENSSFEDILNSNRTKNIIKGFESKKLVEELCRKCGYVKRNKLI